MILGSLFTATFPMETISPAVGIGVRSMTAIFIILLTTLVPLTEVHAADKVGMRGARRLHPHPCPLPEGEGTE